MSDDPESRAAGDGVEVRPESFRAMAEAGPSGSSARAYRALVMGRPGLWPWLRYEMLVSLLTFWAGAVGLYLRSRLFPRLFARCGRGVVFGCGLQLRQPDRVAIGARSVLDDLAALSVRGGEGLGIEIGERVFVGRGSVINARDGVVRVGDDTSLGAQCRLAADGGELRIGRFVLIAAYCYIGGGYHRFDRTDIPIARQGNALKGGAVIEDDCWIGAGSIVADGARIGRGSVIGANSLVLDEIPPYSVAFGTPARVQRSRLPPGGARPGPPSGGAAA